MARTALTTFPGPSAGNAHLMCEDPNHSNLSSGTLSIDVTVTIADSLGGETSADGYEIAFSWNSAGPPAPMVDVEVELCQHDPSFDQDTLIVHWLTYNAEHATTR